MQAITSGPVCPQSLPSRLIPWKSHFNDSSSSSTSSNSEATSAAGGSLSMPKPRLRFLQLARTQLLRQSEDCLYLNVFVPKLALMAASSSSASTGSDRTRKRKQQERGKNPIHHFHPCFEYFGHHQNLARCS